ncbi:MAG: phospholipase A [Firmicutes bacterium]|nr:phospholipase A [Bacillota bacterium]MCM1400587.1 phospholipase A [Bacteroides sp.]MCM1477486.1 phospholipase A [Bacteroides sp.]
MEKKLLSFLLCMFALLLSGEAKAQIVAPDSLTFDADSIKRAFDNQPYFGLYKDNYFIFGLPIGEKPTRKNSNVKFQISFAQRLTKSVLPWDTYLFLFYTQKVFWNVLEKSLPMTDLNFNPGIGLVKPLFVKNRFIGKLMLLVEHESNGKDGVKSRSWNKISLGANIMIDPNFIVHGKVWLPIIDGGENRDILNYAGIYQMGTQFYTPDRRFGAAVTLVKRKGWALNYNTIIELNYRLFKSENQYLFAQYYNGYGEGLLEYKRFHSMFRVGIVIKPRIFSDY